MELHTFTILSQTLRLRYFLILSLIKHTDWYLNCHFYSGDNYILFSKPETLDNVYIFIFCTYKHILQTCEIF